jgi:hypothetical protein
MSTIQYECNICYEKLGDINCSTTECGHRFCFQCIANAMCNSNKCPCCRRKLYEKPNTPDNNYNIIEPRPADIRYMGSIDKIALKLEQEGVTMTDVLSFYNNRYNSKGARYQMHNDTCFYTIDWLEDIIPRIFDEVDGEQFQEFMRQSG